MTMAMRRARCLPPHSTKGFFTLWASISLGEGMPPLVVGDVEGDGCEMGSASFFLSPPKEVFVQPTRVRAKRPAQASGARAKCPWMDAEGKWLAIASPKCGCVRPEDRQMRRGLEFIQCS